jgi:hypothetical protein
MVEFLSHHLSYNEFSFSQGSLKYELQFMQQSIDKHNWVYKLWLMRNQPQFKTENDHFFADTKTCDKEKNFTNTTKHYSK